MTGLGSGAEAHIAVGRASPQQVGLIIRHNSVPDRGADSASARFAANGLFNRNTNHNTNRNTGY
jgi:hypothetical protein